MACDICGTNSKEIETILNIYKTKEVKQVCPSCAKTITKQIRKVQAYNVNFLQTVIKKFMLNMRKAHD